MNWSRAVYGGVLGGAAMTLLQLMGRALGFWPMNLELGLGSMATGALDAGSWWLGLLFHLVASAFFGLAYGLLFEWIDRAGAGMGVSIGAIHGLLSGVVLGFLPAVHPLMPDPLPAPGAFAMNAGPIAVVGFLLLHVLFGGVVGRLYSLRVPVPETFAPEERRRRPTELVGR